MKFLLATAAILVLSCPALAQNVRISDLPPAAPISAGDKLPISQAGATKAATPAQITTFLGTQFEPFDADLAAIAQIVTQPFGRSLLAQADAGSVRSLISVTATGQDGTYAFRANNLSDLANAASARLNLGLGTLAIQQAGAVAITGGSVTGITDLAVADGGTGASTAVAARANLAAAASGANTDITSITGSAARLTNPQAINGVPFDGTAAITINAVDSTARVPATRLVSTTAPLLGGGDLSADRTLSISAATSAAAGTMSASDKSKLDGIASGATANVGTVTSVAVTTANGVSGTVANATTTPAISLALGAITPSSVAATGAISGTTGTFTGALSATNVSGTNTGDQTSVTGNAGTATKWATARTLSITGDLAWTSPALDGSANVSAVGTLATVNTNVGTFGSTSAVPVIGVNGKGLITSVSTAALGTMATQSAASYALLSGAAFTGPISSPGATFSGSIVATGTGTGQAQFVPGDANHTGYLAYVASNGARQGYCGYALTNGPIICSSDTGAGYSFQGGPTQVVRVCYTTTVCDYAGAGTPLGNVTADVGSTYRRTDGGAATTFYVKESGSGANTGWVAK